MSYERSGPCLALEPVPKLVVGGVKGLTVTDRPMAFAGPSVAQSPLDSCVVSFAL